MPDIQVVIKGRNARESAQQLVNVTEGAGELTPSPKHEEGTRSIDWSAVVEFFAIAKPIVGTLGGTVTMAYTIWKWRRDLRSGQDVTLKKKKNGKEEEMEVYPDTTEEEIEEFLELKPLEKQNVKTKN